LGVLLVLATAIVASRYPRESAGWTVRDLRSLTSDPGPERRPRISPDGSRLAYSQIDPATGIERIVVRSVDQSQRIRVSARVTFPEKLPAWSPDATRIAFARVGANGSCNLYIASSLGGSESEVGACGSAVSNYFDWTPDGNSLIVSDPVSANSPALVLSVLDLASGARHALSYQRAESDQDLEAHYSADGAWIAFRRGPAPFSDLYVMRADGGSARQLTHLAARIPGFSWTPDGSGLIFSSNPDGQYALYAVNVSGGNIRPLDVEPATFPSAARGSGTVVYEIPRTKNTLAEATLGTGTLDPHLLAPSTGSDAMPAFSPDGTRLAFVSNRSGSQQLWLYDGAEAGMLTSFHDAVVLNPDWSADGRNVLVTVRGGGDSGLVEVEVSSRRSREVAKSQEHVLSAAHGPEPDSFLLIRRMGGEDNLVFLEKADSAQERQTVVAVGVRRVQFVPATRAAYYTKADAAGVFRRALGGGPEQRVTPATVTIAPDAWRIVDGRVWHLTGPRLRPFELRACDPENGDDERVALVDGELRDLNFSVAPARDRVAFATMGPEDVDIGAFDLAAAASP